MAKKRLLRKLDEQAASETEARKQKDLAEGQYAVDPSTGKPVDNSNDPTNKVRMVESTNLKPMEGSSREVIKTTETPVKTPSEAFVGDRRYLDSVDLQKSRIEVANQMDSPNIADRYAASGNASMTPEEIEVSIAANNTQGQSDNAVALIEREAEAQKVAAPEDAATIDYNAAQLKANNSSIGDEKMNNILSPQNDVSAIEKAYNKYQQTGDESVFSGITRKDVQNLGNKIDEDAILGMNEEQANRYKQYVKIAEKYGPKPEPAIEKQGLTDYYPDMGQPLQVGSYSGSIVGSIPIFTAKGGVLPMNIYDSRRRALQKEAQEKEKQKMQLFELAKVNAAPQYQQELDNEAYSTINDYLKTVNYNVVPGDQNWMALQENLNRINNVKKGTVEIQSWTNKVIDDLSKPDRHVPEYKQKLAAEWLRGGYTMADMINNPKKQKELYNLRNKIKSYDNLSNYTAAYVDKLKDSKSIVPLAANFRNKISEIPATQQDELIASAAEGDFNKFMTLTMKYMPDSDIALHAKKLWESSDFADKEGTPEQVAKNAGEYLEYFNAFIGKEIIPKVTIMKNNRLGWAELARRKQADADAKITRWQTIAQNSMSDDTKSVFANASKMTEKGLFEALGQANNGMKFQKDRNEKIYGTFEVASSEKNRRQTRIGDEQVFGMPFNKWFKSIPTKTDMFGKITTDVDKLPAEQRALANYLIKYGYDENAIVDVQTTGYMVYPEYTDAKGNKRFLTVEDIQKNPGLADNIGTSAFREGSIIIKEQKNFGTADSPFYKEVDVTIPTKSFKKYDLGSADNVNELDGITAGDADLQKQANQDFPANFNVSSGDESSTIVGDGNIEISGDYN